MNRNVHNFKRLSGSTTQIGYAKMGSCVRCDVIPLPITNRFSLSCLRRRWRRLRESNLSMIQNFNALFLHLHSTPRGLSWQCLIEHGLRKLCYSFNIVSVVTATLWTSLRVLGGEGGGGWAERRSGIYPASWIDRRERRGKEGVQA